MAWQMPGQWNPGVPQMTPDMNMGSYTPEQWAVVQQQNWQQWTQWQQQYSQWQSQYGEKYAQQMQSMQAMGMMPPLPTTNAAPPPAPPPPEKPPPPPHENNQPLFGQPNPVPAPGPLHQNQHTGSSNNVNIPTGNSQNWQKGTEARQEASLPMVNAEALKKLAEEERLFDIQFEKWEEEIQKWKRENVNHPDRQAYNEYEQKFETCRAQLLERRQVMKQKRARLLGQAVPAPVTALTGNSTALAPQQPNPNRSSNMQSQSNNSSSILVQSDNHYKPQEQPQNTHRPNNTKMVPQNFKIPPPQNYQDNYNSTQHYNDTQSQGGYNRNNNKPDPQVRYESYEAQDMEAASYSPAITSTNFLPGAGSAKGIPGLDLVPEEKDGKQTEVIDITEERTAADQPPDYTTISKGINNILGDEKIMNILSMVRDQVVAPPTGPNKQVPGPRPYGQNTSYNNNMNNSGAPPNNQWDRNQGPQNQQQQYGAPPNISHNRGPGFPDQSREQDSQPYPPQRRNNDRENNAFMDPYNRNMHDHGMQRQNIQGPNMQGPNMQGPNMQGRNMQGPNMPGPNMQGLNMQGPNMQGPNMQGPNMQGPNMQGRNMQGPNMPGPNMQGLNMQGPNMQGPNMQGQNMEGPNMHGPNMQGPNMQGPNMQGPNMQGPNIQGPNMHNRGPPMRPNMPNMPPLRPHMQEAQGYQDETGYNRRPPPPRGPHDNMRPNMPPPRPLMQGVAGYDSESDYSRGPHDNRRMHDNMNNQALNQPVPPPPPPQPARPKWTEEPLFTPSIIVEYEHKPLRLKAREFIEPVHMFDYNHKSKDGDNNKKKDFEREADELFQRKPRRFESDDAYRESRFAPEDTYRGNRFAAEDVSREYAPRDFERRHPREEFRNDHRDMRDARDGYRDLRVPPKEEYDDRRRPDERYDDRRRDDRDRYARREDFTRDRGRDREDSYRDRQRDLRRDDSRNRSRSRDRDSRKRGRSRESTISETSSKKSKEPEKKNETPKHVVMIDDILEPPGREMRPEKIVIILRGPPGSGKSYLAKLIRDREAEHGGTARIMSIDDYFMQEGEIEEKDPTTGKIVKKPSLKYEYEAKSEETYLNSLKRAFKRSLTDGYFNFLIYDAVNDTLRSYADIWNFARQQGFQVYICTMELDSQICFKRNIHGRTLGDIQVVCTRFFPTPDHHIQLDATTLLQSGAITEVHMEDVDDEVIMEDAQEEVENSFTSKWEKLDDAAQLARLDGTSKPLRPSQLSMEDYLQLDDWKPSTAKPGKKTVRWADIEESRQQEKMRAIGFVVGQTDWNRMTDPTKGSSALTQTKYIERVRRN